MLVIVVLAVLLLMTPLWMHVALGLSGATNAYATPDMAFDVSDRTVAELLLGPGTFAMFDADEAAHLRDARLVLYVFLGLAVAGAAVIAVALRRASSESGTWRAVGRGGAVLVVAVVVLGLVGALAFEPAFELFHAIFFPGGNWAFPADSNLVRLYPLGFWQLSAAALGVLGIAGGALTWLVGRRRARALEASR
jgi:hypothetical protein